MEEAASKEAISLLISENFSTGMNLKPSKSSKVFSLLWEMEKRGGVITLTFSTFLSRPRIFFSFQEKAKRGKKEREKVKRLEVKGKKLKKEEMRRLERGKRKRKKGRKWSKRG